MILDIIVEDKKIRLTELKKRVTLQEVRSKAEGYKGDCHSFKTALKKEGVSIIGEFKLASPSLGVIKKTIDLEERICAYNQAVDAISCLTEEDHFHGNTDFFKDIRKISTLPMLRKDFMIDEYQFYEAKAIGADAVLLIAAILDDDQMKHFYQLSKELGLDALVEVHDEKELERALQIGAEIIGINNRNLNDFSVALETTGRLKQIIPRDKIVVSESGIISDKDISYLKECGVDAFLIGRALMESNDPKELAIRWKG
ncbi:MAG: indole-3-glycerol phosphate synthase TrpC [Lachnospiraceae bacterium]